HGRRPRCPRATRASTRSGRGGASGPPATASPPTSCSTTPPSRRSRPVGPGRWPPSAASRASAPRSWSGTEWMSLASSRASGPDRLGADGEGEAEGSVERGDLLLGEGTDGLAREPGLAHGDEAVAIDHGVVIETLAGSDGHLR